MTWADTSKFSSQRRLRGAENRGGEAPRMKGITTNEQMTARAKLELLERAKTLRGTH